jgi:anti-sigma factor RsiW
VSGHLGDQVAAFVDGQLDYARREKALEHLSGCDRCQALVEQERWVKTRVQTLPGAEPSADLLTSLTLVSAHEPAPPAYPGAYRVARWPAGQGWLRRGGLVLAGAGSLAAGVIGVAYAVGSAETSGPVPVSPPVGQFSAQFAGSNPVPLADPAMDAIPALGGRSPAGGR